MHDECENLAACLLAIAARHSHWRRMDTFERVVARLMVPGVQHGQSMWPHEQRGERGGGGVLKPSFAAADCNAGRPLGQNKASNQVTRLARRRGVCACVRAAALPCRWPNLQGHT